jgi:hypothetical protein
MPLSEIVQLKIVTFVNHSWQHQAKKVQLAVLYLSPARAKDFSTVLRWVVQSVFMSEMEAK